MTSGPTTIGRGTFASALSSRDLRWFLGHHALAGTGQSLGIVAVSVALFDQTGSTAWVAAANAVRLAPYLLVSGFAGVIAGRMPVRRVLLWSAGLRALALVVLAAAVAAEAPPLVVVALVAAATTIGTPCYPGLAAVVPTVVPAEDLAPANGLLNTIETSSWMIGPAAGGLLLLAGDPAVALLVNAGLFGLGALALLPTRAGARAVAHADEPDEPIWAAFASGIRAAVGSVEVGVPLMLVVIVNVVFGGATVGLLVVAEDLLHTGKAGFGLLNAALGIGGFVGVAITNRVSAMRRPVVGIMAATVVAGVPFALLAAVDVSWVALVLMVVAGAGSVVTEVVAMTVMLRSLPPHMITRVFGLTDSLLVGSILVGSVAAPMLIDATGLRWSLVIVGAALPITAVVAARQLQVLASRGTSRRAALTPRLELLQVQPWLAHASPLALECLAASGTEESLAPGRVVIREGDDPDDFFVILDGMLDVTQRGIVVNRMGPGEGFGERGLLGAMPRTATVTATGGARVLRMRGDVFVNAVNAVPSSADGSVGAGVVARLASGAVVAPVD
ncbi:MAG: MFS transporter [Acidimicrobiia bacterium]|nr:MFS transporter [Acidimicrobiia bacterium]